MLFGTSAVIAGIGIFGVVVMVPAGGLNAGLHWLQGYTVYPASQTVERYDNDPNHGALVRFELRNIGKSDVKVVGVQPSCTCVALTELPVAIPARGRAWLEVQYSLPRQKVMEKATPSMLLFLNVESPPVVLRFPQRDPMEEVGD